MPVTILENFRSIGRSTFMSKASLVLLRRLGALSCLLAACIVGCKKDEPPPPLPVAKAVETTEAPLELQPEDAGRPPQEKPAATKPVVRKASGLQQCCTALRQNAASAPEPTKGYMLYAAGVCDLAATQGKDKASAVGVISSALKGAGLPADCK
jgi:hypothetical protein